MGLQPPGGVSCTVLGRGGGSLPFILGGMSGRGAGAARVAAGSRRRQGPAQRSRRSAGRGDGGRRASRSSRLITVSPWSFTATTSALRPTGASVSTSSNVMSNASPNRSVLSSNHGVKSVASWARVDVTESQPGPINHGRTVALLSKLAPPGVSASSYRGHGGSSLRPHPNCSEAEQVRDDNIRPVTPL